MNKPNFKISGLIATGLYGQRQSMRQCRPEKDFRDCSVRELGARIYIQDFEREGPGSLAGWRTQGVGQEKHLQVADVGELERVHPLAVMEDLEFPDARIGTPHLFILCISVHNLYL